jgi:hypothetical protein
MSKLLISEPPLQVLPTLATRIGLNEAIFIQQLHWMSQQDHYGRVVDGRKWIRNSLPDWHKQFPFFSVAALRRIVKNLQEDGLLLCRDDLNRHAYDKTGWYAVDIGAFEKIDGLVERLAEINQKRKEAISIRYEEAGNEEAEVVSLQDEPNMTPLQNVTPHLQNVTPLQNVAEGVTKCKGGGYKMITTIPKTSSKTSSKKAKDQHHQHAEEVGKIDVDDEDVIEETAITPFNPMPAEVAAMATAVADWMGYTGDITREMQQHQVTPAVLLAWAFWLKVEGGKCRNPVGVCRSKWSSNERRGPELPPARWLELAQAWLDLDNDERLELLGTGGISHLLAFEFPFPDIMPAFCDLYRATSGQPVPAILLPEYPDDPERDTPAAPAAPDNQAATAVPGVDQLWRDMIQNDSSPAVKTWLQASRLLVDPGSLTAVVCVRNSYAAEYVSGRLLDYLNMAWPSLAAESGWENLRITGAVDHVAA